ncbi:MAG TPA: Holliday junction branch migration protein RuvA [Polyangia bacterium]|nr:Holliday junction branch migration protein RuvA [Polyangia bacterium]
MLARLRGTLAEKSIDQVIVDVGGVGFRVAVSLQTLAELPAVGQPVTLLTHLQVREDALTLFGFSTDEERTAFELCIGVQMIGPKLAMNILSSLAPHELGAAVRAGDHARLTRIPGIGKKTAERLVLELRDKVEKVGLGAGPRGEARAQSERPTASTQVASALVNLGYRPADAERAADQACAASAGAPVAELVKRALRSLAE